MKIIRDGLQLCADCTYAAIYGEPTDNESIDARVNAGLLRLGPLLVPAFDNETSKGYNEFSTLPCDCCESTLFGNRHEFALLGEE